MKTYRVNINDLPKIRAIFSGYIFRREENGVGYIKCIDRHRNIINRYGITIEECDPSEAE